MIKGLLFGAIVGGVVVWIYRYRIRDYIDDVTHLEATEGPQGVVATVEKGLSQPARRVS